MHSSRIRSTLPSQKSNNSDNPTPETQESPVPTMLEAQRNRVPTGFRFLPSNEELVGYYLFNKIIKNPVNDGHVIDDCDLYGDEPCEIWSRFAGNGGVQELYLFTELKKRKPHHERFDRTVGSGPGKWQNDAATSEFVVKISTDKTENLCIKGFMKKFTYKNPNSEQNGAWLMREFRCNLSDNIALCVLKWNGAAAEDMDETPPVQVKLGVTLNPKLLQMLVEPKNVDRKIFVGPRIQEAEKNQRMMKEQEVESPETTLVNDVVEVEKVADDSNNELDLELSLAPPRDGTRARRHLSF